jgi:signal transduction protein with GAF and PtsI domain
MNELNKVIATITKQFSADVGMIHQLNPKENVLYIIAYTEGFPKEFIEKLHCIPVGKGIAGNTVASKKPIVFSDIVANTSQVIRPGAKVIGIHGMISVPIFSGDDIVGTLGVGFIKKYQASEEEINKLIAIGKGLADQVKNFSFEK